MHKRPADARRGPFSTVRSRLFTLITMLRVRYFLIKIIILVTSRCHVKKPRCLSLLKDEAYARGVLLFGKGSVRYTYSSEILLQADLVGSLRASFRRHRRLHRRRRRHRGSLSSAPRRKRAAKGSRISRLPYRRKKVAKSKSRSFLLCAEINATLRERPFCPMTREIFPDRLINVDQQRSANLHKSRCDRTK